MKNYNYVVLLELMFFFSGTIKMHFQDKSIPRRGVLQVKILQAKYEPKLEFFGRRVQNKNPSVGGVWIFLEQQSF